jgi:hypothetical protein
MGLKVRPSREPASSEDECEPPPRQPEGVSISFSEEDSACIGPAGDVAEEVMDLEGEEVAVELTCSICERIEDLFGEFTNAELQSRWVAHPVTDSLTCIDCMAVYGSGDLDAWQQDGGQILACRWCGDEARFDDAPLFACSGIGCREVFCGACIRRHLGVAGLQNALGSGSTSVPPWRGPCCDGMLRTAFQAFTKAVLVRNPVEVSAGDFSRARQALSLLKLLQISCVTARSQ